MPLPPPCSALFPYTTLFRSLRTLYQALHTVAPTLGASVSLAAVVGRVDGPQAALRLLDSLDDPAAARFQPAWAAKAHLLARSEEHTSELQSRGHLVCRLLLE